MENTGVVFEKHCITRDMQKQSSRPPHRLIPSVYKRSNQWSVLIGCVIRDNAYERGAIVASVGAGVDTPREKQLD